MKLVIGGPCLFIAFLCFLSVAVSKNYCDELIDYLAECGYNNLRKFVRARGTYLTRKECQELGKFLENYRKNKDPWQPDMDDYSELKTFLRSHKRDYSRKQYNRLEDLLSQYQFHRLFTETDRYDKYDGFQEMFTQYKRCYTDDEYTSFTDISDSYRLFQWFKRHDYGDLFAWFTNRGSGLVSRWQPILARDSRGTCDKSIDGGRFFRWLSGRGFGKDAYRKEKVTDVVDFFLALASGHPKDIMKFLADGPYSTSGLDLSSDCTRKTDCEYSRRYVYGAASDDVKFFENFCNSICTLYIDDRGKRKTCEYDCREKLYASKCHGNCGGFKSCDDACDKGLPDTTHFTGCIAKHCDGVYAGSCADWCYDKLHFGYGATFRRRYRFD